MPYTTLTVLINGSLESETDYEVDTPKGEAAFRAALQHIERTYTNCDHHAAVYLLNHGHDQLEQDEDCACIQYQVDHHPDFEYNHQED